MLARSRMRPDCSFSRLLNFISRKVIRPMKKKGRIMIIVNCQLKKMPNSRPKQDKAKASQITPNLVPAIS